MKLTRCEDDISGGVYFQHCDETGQFFIGIYPVIFGNRVVVHPGDKVSVFSLCAGPDQENVQRLWDLCWQIMVPIEDPIAALSVAVGLAQMETNHRRPFGVDPVFVKTIEGMAAQSEEKVIAPTLPDIMVLRGIKEYSK